MSLSPLVIPPSFEWAGDNGLWSTFYISIGQPVQSLQLLPGTSAVASNIFWTVIPEGCLGIGKQCEGARGGAFKSNESTTWSTQGLVNQPEGALYNLIAPEEGRLGLAGNASYGYENVGLGRGQSGLPVLQQHVVAGLWTNDFYLGVLPLSPLPFNFTFAQPAASMLSTLRNTTIPSLSWAYTAGAWYGDQRSNHFGSLVLGGYDASRFKANDVTFKFGPDYSRDLLVVLSAITYDTALGAPLLTTGINMFIDSVVSEIWLPVSVCQSFAAAFSLSYHPANYYLVNETAHAVLLRQNPTFTFSISNGSSKVDIVLPYAAFDLNLTFPIVGNTTRYFPIRRAQNETQYVIGRAFLQEAYVIADYDRKSFSVSQALFPPTAVDPDIVAILSPGEGSASGRRLTTGSIVGIVVGVVAGVLVLLLSCWWLLRRQRRKRAAKNAQLYSYPEDAKTSLEVEARPAKNGTTSGINIHELPHEDAAFELTPGKSFFELPQNSRSELPGHKVEGELEATTHVSELP